MMRLRDRFWFWLVVLLLSGTLLLGWAGLLVHAHDALHYIQAPPDWQKWFSEAKTTEQSRARLAAQGFVWHSCCNHADRVKTRFRVNRESGADEWWYLDPKTEAWVRLENDIIHHEDDPTMPPQLKVEGVLFVYNGVPTCFWAPQEGG